MIRMNICYFLQDHLSISFLIRYIRTSIIVLNLCIFFLSDIFKQPWCNCFSRWLHLRMVQLNFLNTNLFGCVCERERER